MNYQDVVFKINQRFKSGNSVPVSQARITKEEWDLLQQLFNDMERDIQSYRWKNKELCHEDNTKEYVCSHSQ